MSTRRFDQDLITAQVLQMSVAQKADAFTALMNAVAEGYEIRLENSGVPTRSIGIHMRELPGQKEVSHYVSVAEFGAAKFNWMAMSIEGMVQTLRCARYQRETS